MLQQKSVKKTMKYDVLNRYRQHLRQTCASINTADRYYYALVGLLSDQQFSSPRSIDMEKLYRNLTNLSTKNEISAAKNALLRFAEINPDFPVPDNSAMASLSKRRTNKTKALPKTLSLDSTLRRINGLRDEKAKLAFRLMLASGGRVSEIAMLQAQDIQIIDGQLFVDIRHGKGGSNALVPCLPDAYLLDRLPIFLKDADLTQQVFYSRKALEAKAKKLGIECHDLRRMAAQVHCQNAHKAGVETKQSKEETRVFLRHSNVKMTEHYLNYRKME